MEESGRNLTPKLINNKIMSKSKSKRRKHLGKRKIKKHLRKLNKTDKAKLKRKKMTTKSRKLRIRQSKKQL